MASSTELEKFHRDIERANGKPARQDSPATQTMSRGTSSRVGEWGGDAYQQFLQDVEDIRSGKKSVKDTKKVGTVGKNNPYAPKVTFNQIRTTPRSASTRTAESEQEEAGNTTRTMESARAKLDAIIRGEHLSGTRSGGGNAVTQANPLDQDPNVGRVIKAQAKRGRKNLASAAASGQSMEQGILRYNTKRNGQNDQTGREGTGFVKHSSEEYGQHLRDRIDELDEQLRYAGQRTNIPDFDAKLEERNRLQNQYDEWENEMYYRAQAEALSALSADELHLLDEYLALRGNTTSATPYSPQDRGRMAAYNELYRHFGDQTDSLLEYRGRQLNAAYTQALTADYAERAKHAPVGASVLSVLTNLAGGPMAAVSTAGQMISRGLGLNPNEHAPLDTNDYGYRMQNLTKALRQSVTEEILGGDPENISTWRQIAGGGYQTVMSTLDSLAAAGLGPVAGAFLMSTNAATTTLQDYSERGASPKQAVEAALAAGFFEYIFEAISIGNFAALQEVDPQSIGQVLGNIAKSMGVNFTEEALTELANAAADMTLPENISNYKTRIRQLQQQGKLSREEAQRQAAAEIGDQVLQAGVGGALQGLLMGGVGSAAGYINNRDNRAEAARMQTQGADQTRDTVLRGEERAAQEAARRAEAEQVPAAPASDLEITTGREYFQDQTPAAETAPVQQAEQQTPAPAVQAAAEELRAEPVQTAAQETEEIQEARQIARETVDSVLQENSSLEDKDAAIASTVELYRDMEQNAAADAIEQLWTAERNGTTAPAVNEIKPGQAAVREYEEETNYGRPEIVPGDSIQRNDGAGAGGEAGELAAPARGDQTGSRGSSPAKTAVGRQNRVNGLQSPERVSPRQLGVRQGVETPDLTIMPREIWDDDMRETAERVKAETGLDTVYYTGTMKIQTGRGTTRRVQGVVVGNRILLQADNLRVDIGTVADHEIFHTKVRQDPGLVYTLREQIREEYSEEEFRRIVDAYAQALDGVYAGEDGLNVILEELFADAYAGMNAFGAEASRYQETARAVVNQRAGTGRYVGDAETRAGLDKSDTVERDEQYSIGFTEDDRPIAIVDNDILRDIDTSSWNNAKRNAAKKAAKDALLQFKDGILVNGIQYKVNRDSRREFTRSNDTDRLYRTAKTAFADKMRSADIADDIIFATTDWARDGGLKHQRSDSFTDFEHGTVLIQSGDNQYLATTTIGITNQGEHVFYDVVNIVPIRFMTNERPSTTASVKNDVGDIQEDLSANTLSQIVPAVNTDSETPTDELALTRDENERYSISDDEDAEYEALAQDPEANREELQRMVDRAAEEAGYTIHAYHGTGRADRVGNVFRPERATSGPMAFFTDSREIAENYSRDKKDTSIAYDPEYDSYETQFRARHAGTGRDYAIYKLWGYIPISERAKIAEKAKHVRIDVDGDGDIIYDPDAQEANGGWNWQLKSFRGDVLKALNEQWLNSGNLFNEERNYLQVLELAGVTDALKKAGFEMPRYMDPEYREEAVYDTYLKIENPFDATTMVDEDFIRGFEEFAEENEEDYTRESAGSDYWDKNDVTAEDFADRMRDDLERGTTHAWTSIPDVVTAYLQELGYDGIRDAGGKNGGQSHTVWVPFTSEQIKRSDPVTYDDQGNVIPLSERFNTEEVDIRYSVTDDEDAEYEALAQDPEVNEAQLQRMVDQAAKETMQNPALDARGNPLHLYHGTRFYGWTEYRDNTHDTPFIYTSTDRTVAAHYAGDNNYAAARPIGRKYEGGNSIDSIIRDAETVWGAKYNRASEADKGRIYKETRDEAVKIADKLDEMYFATPNLFENLDDVTSNAVARIEDLFFTLRDSDEMQSYDSMKSETYGMKDWLQHEIELYNEDRAKVKTWFEDNYDSVNADQKKFFRYLLGYELGDAAIDIEYRIGKMMQSDTLLMSADDSLHIPEETRKSLDMSHAIGAYDLYGDLGANPYVIDCNGAQFWGIKNPDMGDGYYSTDSIAKWAQEHGYTSVIMKNIYDYGDKADNYVFFGSNQIKSADPVTYDDQGNVIPLSERFNTEEVDIRYSVTGDEDAEYEALAQDPEANEAQLQRMVDQAARSNGYVTPRLYHGTRGFGFTWFNTAKSDDGISIFATNRRETAETYAGQTNRNRIGDSYTGNVDGLRGEELLEEAKRYLPRYEHLVLMSEQEKARQADESRRDIETTLADAADFFNRNERALDQGKLAISNRLLNALSDMSVARDEDTLQSAWDSFQDAVWDLKWEDESLTDDFLQNIGYRSLQIYKNQLNDFMYTGDIYEDRGQFGFSYVFDNQLALETEAEVHKGIYELYGRPGRQLVIDADGSNWNSIMPPEELMLYGTQSTREIASAAKAAGYDSVLIRNVRDNGGETAYNGESDVYIFFNAEDLKSADPVTYDSDGNIIPLDARFNHNDLDIRYSSADNEEDVRRPAGITAAMRSTRRGINEAFGITRRDARAMAQETLNAFMDSTLERGEIDPAELERAARTLWREGGRQGVQDEYAADIRQWLRENTPPLYVPQEVRSEFSTDWGRTRQALSRMGIRVTESAADMGVDQFWQSLGQRFPGTFDQEETDRSEMLRQMLDWGDRGRAGWISNQEDQSYGMSPSQRYEALREELYDTVEAFRQAVQDTYDRDRHPERLSQRVRGQYQYADQRMETGDYADGTEAVQPAAVRDDELSLPYADYMEQQYEAERAAEESGLEPAGAEYFEQAPEAGEGYDARGERWTGDMDYFDGDYYGTEAEQDFDPDYRLTPRVEGERTQGEILRDESRNTAEEALQNYVSQGDFRATDHLNNLGVKIDGSVPVNYGMARGLLYTDEANRSILQDIRRAERRLGLDARARSFASDIAAGLYTEADIPSTMDADKVMELAQYYMDERALGRDMIRQQRVEINQQLDDRMKDLFQSVDEVARRQPQMVRLNYNTPQRNMRALFGDELGERINREIFDPVARNEAERIRWINRQFDAVRTFEDSRGKRSGLTKEESALVQMVIEGRGIAEQVASMEMEGAIRDAAEDIRHGGDPSDAAREHNLSQSERNVAEKYARWIEAQELLESDRVDSVKIENAVKTFQNLFNQYYDAINDFLVVHGYAPIGFIRGYAPHMQSEESVNALSKVLQAFGIQTDVTELDTGIAGRTKDFRPNKRWNPYFLSREGDTANYDILTGFESYVDYLSDVLYHTDDIMKLRRMSRYFRQTYSGEEIRNTIDWAMGLQDASREQQMEFLRDQGRIDRGSVLSDRDVAKAMDEYMDQLFDQITKTTKFGNLVMWLDNYTNILAGKQNSFDRGPEELFGRRSLNIGSRMTRWFAQSNVAGNLSSVLNQASQLPMVTAENGYRHTAQALFDILSGRVRKTGFAEQSDLLTGKHGVNFLVRTPGEMVTSALFKPAEFADGLVSTIAVRAAYRRALDQGMSEADAMRFADQYGTKIMASRAKGSKPNAFESRTFFMQAVNMFQIEALNSWEHIFRDLPKDFHRIAATQGKRKAALALAGVIVKALLGAFVMNRITEELYGGTPAPFDLLGLTANFIASGEGLSTNDWIRRLIDNGMERISGERIFGTERQDKDQAFKGWDAVEDTFYNLSNEVPFWRNASGLLGWGDETLPVPDVAGGISDILEATKNNGVISGETGEAAASLVTQFLPLGKQGLKTYQGIRTMAEGARMKGYGDRERLQYLVEDSLWNWIRAVMFGNAALGETQSFYASGERGLSKEQTQRWKAMVQNGIDPKEALSYIRFKGQKGIVKADVMDYIDGLNLTNEQKDALYYDAGYAESRINEAPWH